MITVAPPGEPGDPMTKEFAARIRKQDAQRDKDLAAFHAQNRRQARLAAENGYDETRPNHMFHDSLGDPATCTQNHNHPHHLGE